MAFARSFVSFAALLVPLAAQAAAPPAPPIPAGDRLLVANKADHSLSIFAPTERREVATLPTGNGPHEVAVSKDGTLAVVTDYGAQKPGQTLTIVDVASAKVLRTIDLVGDDVDAEGKPRKKTYLRPHGVQFVAPDRVVVTSESTRCLLLVDVATGKVERTWTTPQASMHMVSVSSDLQRAAASSIRDGNVVFFGVGADGVASTPPVACGEGSEGLAVHPRTGVVWVGNRAADTVSIVDAATAKVVKTVPTGDFPFRVAFTPDGKWALVTCAEGGELQVFDAATAALVRAIPIHADGSELSAQPMGVCTDPDGVRAWVTCGRGGFVAGIDLANGTVVERLPGRAGCDGIAYARAAVAAGELKR